MYNIYNKSDVYYLFNVQNGTMNLIGDKKDLLNLLYRGISTHYKDPERWDNKFFLDINMGNDTKIYIERYYVRDICKSFCEYTYYQRPYIFYDGYGRTIDVRNLKNELVEFIKNDLNKYIKIENEKRHNCFSKKWKYRKRKYHTGNFERNKFPRKIHQARIIDSNQEYREYNFKKVENSKKKYPDYWDDAVRRVDSNWKTQYKVNKQHNIHNKGKDDKSIRNYYYEDFTIDKIDKMLEEDFFNKE